jgi:hypothetical protein
LQIAIGDGRTRDNRAKETAMRQNSRLVKPSLLAVARETDLAGTQRTAVLDPVTALLSAAADAICQSLSRDPAGFVARNRQAAGE